MVKDELCSQYTTDDMKARTGPEGFNKIKVGVLLNVKTQTPYRHEHLRQAMNQCKLSFHFYVQSIQKTLHALSDPEERQESVLRTPCDDKCPTHTFP
jgi:hypothetical protein